MAISREDFEAILDSLEINIEQKRKMWNNTVTELTDRLKNKDPRELVELQASTISHKQMILDELSEYAVKLAKDLSKKKLLYKKHLEVYKNYPIKLNAGETGKMVESELAIHERKLNIYEIYIDFLKNTGSNLDSLNFGIKNKIELVNIFGID